MDFFETALRRGSEALNIEAVAVAADTSADALAIALTITLPIAHAHLMPDVQRVAEAMMRDHPARCERLIARWVGDAARYVEFKEGREAPPYPEISNDEIRETIESNQLRLIKERGADMTIFSPRASAMAPHVGDQSVAVKWAQVCNDLIARVIAQKLSAVMNRQFLVDNRPGGNTIIGAQAAYACIQSLGISMDVRLEPGRSAAQSLRETAEEWRQKAARLQRDAILLGDAAAKLEEDEQAFRRSGSREVA